jgi:hypothetical protein
MILCYTFLILMSLLCAFFFIAIEYVRKDMELPRRKQ